MAIRNKKYIVQLGQEKRVTLAKRVLGGTAAVRKIPLVMDNVNRHSPASLYEAFTPTEARRSIARLESVYTPKRGGRHGRD